MVAQTYGAGRVILLADSDIFGDDSIRDHTHRALWRNLVTWAAATGGASAGRTES
jgi:hypothetical protein